MGSENQTTTPWTLTKCNAKTCPHNRSVFGLTSPANTLTQEPKRRERIQRGHLKETLYIQKNLTGQKRGRWRQFGAQYVLGGGLAIAKRDASPAVLVGENSGDALEASSALICWVWGIPAALSRGFQDTL